MIDTPTYSNAPSGRPVVTIKKQVPRINKIEKVVEVEEIVSKPVPNYIEDIVEVEQVVQKPVYKKVQQFKEVINYQPVEVIREEEVVTVEKRIQKVDIPVYQEEKRVVQETSELPFTLDRHVESLVVRPFENKVVQFEEKVVRPVLVDRYEERVEREDVPIMIKRIKETGKEHVQHEVRDKHFEVTLHGEHVEEVPVDVPEPVAHHVSVDKHFEIDRFVEEVQIKERKIDRPVEQIEETHHDKPFQITFHTETHKSVDQEIPIHVKIFKETIKPVQRHVPSFAPVDVAVPHFRHQEVEIEHDAVHTENYKHVHHDVDLPYHQYKVENRAAHIDIAVDVVKVKEVPTVVEETQNKEYIIEQIREEPERVEKEVVVVLEKRIEEPVLNKKYEDEIVEKTVELYREVVEDEIIYVEEHDSVSKAVKLKTLNGMVKVNKVQRPLHLKKSKRRGVLSQKQKRAFEMASRRLADLHFEKEKLEHMIHHHANGHDLNDLNHDHHAINERNAHSRKEIQDLKRKTAELERHIDGLNHQIKTAGPKHETTEHYDEGPLHRITDEIGKVKQHNQKLRDFLAGKHAPTTVHHAPAPIHHTSAPVHHAPVHHAPVHHAPVHHAPVHHTPKYREASPVHHAPVHHHHKHREASPVHHAPVYTPAVIREGPIRSSGVHHHSPHRTHHHDPHDLMTHSHLAESNAPRNPHTGSRVLYASPSHHHAN